MNPPDKIDCEQARRIALAHIGPECVLLDEHCFEKPYGWYFCSQSRAYVETGNWRYLLFGDCGFLVERDGGRIFGFGSGFSKEYWLEAYEKGLLNYNSYDLTIVSVRDLARSVALLGKLDMTFVIPEVAHGVTWRIPRRYSLGQIFVRLLRCWLRQEPCTFTNQSFWGKVEVLDEMAACGACTYELLGYRPD